MESLFGCSLIKVYIEKMLFISNISHRLSTTKDADHIYMFEKQAHYYQDEIA